MGHFRLPWLSVQIGKDLALTVYEVVIQSMVSWLRGVMRRFGCRRAALVHMLTGRCKGTVSQSLWWLLILNSFSWLLVGLWFQQVVVVWLASGWCVVLRRVALSGTCLRLAVFTVDYSRPSVWHLLQRESTSVSGFSFDFMLLWT